MLNNRRLTKKINIGDKSIGADSKVLIQSMTNTKTKDISSTISQIKELEKEGCEIVRSSVPDEESAKALKGIKKEISIPLIADIHFDYKLAILAMENGADAIRINPGNIGGEEKLYKILDVAKTRDIPIRIGVNGGSLEKKILEKYGNTPEAMVESALNHIKIFENFNFDNIVVSLKSSDLEKTIKAYKLFSENSNYPLHLGITEAGTYKSGAIKSAIGIGYLLMDGIGDTIRVSLSDSPVKEIEIAKQILRNTGYIQGPEIISCPTCARTDIDIISLANQVETNLKNINKNIKVAVMGCAVNGPGEARDADIGIAGGKDNALLFVKGEIIGKYSQNEIVSKLMEKIDTL